MAKRTIRASEINGTRVSNSNGERLGRIRDLMINTYNGTIAYAVLSFGGAFGIADKYFAIPWQAFAVDEENDQFILDLPREKLEDAPGFDKNDWPGIASHDYLTRVYNHYGYKPFWDGSDNDAK